MVESVVVANKRRETQSERQGEIQTREGLLGPYSQIQSSTQLESVTVGDVLFMHAGKPYVTIRDIEDPDGMAQMARSAIEQAKKNTRMAGKIEEKPTTTLPSQPQGVQCKKCQSYNPEDAAYCNKCGAKMSFVCGKCKHENPDNAKFCNQCGHPL